MANPMRDEESAKRLARAIASDISIYNEAAIIKGIEEDNLFEVLEEQIEEGRAMIEEGIERITVLSGHLLHYAREWQPQLQWTDVGAVVAKVCDQNRPAAAEQGVSLRIDLPGGLPDVHCDPSLVHMAVTDIVVNAIDACAWKDYGPDERPEVAVRTSAAGDGDAYLIEVRDNGCGMTEEIRENIFTPFFSTKKIAGTGLGLAQTARIIKAHGGQVEVESAPDRGQALLEGGNYRLAVRCRETRPGCSPAGPALLFRLWSVACSRIDWQSCLPVRDG